MEEGKKEERRTEGKMGERRKIGERKGRMEGG